MFLSLILACAPPDNLLLSVTAESESDRFPAAPADLEIGEGSVGDFVETDEEVEVLGDCDDRLGMTWFWRDRESALQVDEVGCGTDCDPYEGDTVCTSERPVLCIRPGDAPNPGVAEDFYNGWTGGSIATTPAVPGCRLVSVEAANDLCAASLGPGWRMAEFHDGGGGWNWWAYGAVDHDSDFWTYIDDQQANCWN